MACSPDEVNDQSNDKRCQFGSRFLTDDKNVFQHNAWDNVQWDEEQEKIAYGKVQQNSLQQVDEDRKLELEDKAAGYWDKFYGIHQNRFFKDRHWLFTEFPELNTEDATSCESVSHDAPSDEDVNKEYPGSHANKRILEVGCGVGNTVFPILSANKDPKLFVYCCDFASTAVNLVREHEEYDSKRCHAFVYDIADTEAPMPFPDATLDIITMIFVLSAITPEKMQTTLYRLARLLKPGGVLLFRDYGRYDLAQLRFKKGQCLSDNFYARGDGTLVYFFTQDEMKQMLTKAGLIEQSNLVDRRLQVNRGKQLKMYRTSPKCMSKSSETQHENFARQLSAFEKLLVISYSRLSKDELYRNLKHVLKAGQKGMLKINSLGDLHECIGLYQSSMLRDGGSDDVTEFFEMFFEEMEYLAQVKQFFHESIYHCLYEFFYHPLYDNSEDEFGHAGFSDDEDDGNKSETERDEHEELEEVKADSPKPAEPATVVKDKQSREGRVRTGRKKSKSTVGKHKSGPIKKKKRQDNRLKVLEKIQKEKAEREALLANQKFEEPKTGREFERLRHKTDNQKLAVAVQEIFDIQDKWNKLISGKPLDMSWYDNDSVVDIKAYKNYAAFEPVFRIMPDLFIKGFKLVELSKVWYNSFRRIVGPYPATHKTVAAFHGNIKQVSESIDAIEKDMDYKINLRSDKQQERRMILNQLMRLDQLKDKKEQCMIKERELKDIYKQLKHERSTEYHKLEKLERDDPEYREVYDQIQYLAERMNSSYKELQTASYELELTNQDLQVELGHSKNLIHQQNDIKQVILDIDTEMPLLEQRQTQLMRTRDKLRDNCRRMHKALYGDMTDKQTFSSADISKSKQIKPAINSNDVKGSNKLATSQHSDGLDEEEAAMDQVLQDQLISENTIRSTPTSVNSVATPIAPLPPISPANVSAAAQEQPRKKERFNANSGGITDKKLAQEYDDRVRRLRKGVELDFSALKEANFDNTPSPRQADSDTDTAGTEADLESDSEIESRPQSKKYTKKMPERYSPLSDVSDDYIYRQPYPSQKPTAPKSEPKTVYILKKSNTPRKQPQSERPDPAAHQMLDTLSMYKRSPMPGAMAGLNALNPNLALEHTEGVFTPFKELSDGDITEDSGTGDSLDSHSDTEAAGPPPPTKGTISGYKHIPRAPEPVQQKPKVSPVKPVPNSRLPKLSKLPKPNLSKPSLHIKPALQPVTQKSPDLKVAKSESPIKPAKHFQLSPVANSSRDTLLMEKPAFHRHIVPVPPEKKEPEFKKISPHRPLQFSKPIKPVPQGNIQLPQSIRSKPQLKQGPARRKPAHVQILESPSDDDDADEVFKQAPVRHTIQPNKTTHNKSNIPAAVNSKRKNGQNAVVRLGKVF